MSARPREQVGLAEMRYRTVSDIEDINRDIAVVSDFIGQDKYRSSLEKIGTSLRAKGFVTPFDDEMFALELDLLNLEKLRDPSGRLSCFPPPRCHRGLDFLIGLGQTIPVLSSTAKTRLLGRIQKGLDEGLWPLQHEFRVAAQLGRLGCDVQFHDLEEGKGFDFIARKGASTFEVEAKAISVFTGWPIKPEVLNKLLVEIKEHFIWTDSSTIPIIAVTTSSSLLPDRTQLRELVSGLNEVAGKENDLIIPGAKMHFVGKIATISGAKLLLATNLHSRMRKKIVLVTPTEPRLIVEMDSRKPIQLERKIVRNLNEAAREQFSRLNPSVIWTHVEFASEERFNEMKRSSATRAGFLDRVASTALLSPKRDHLSQIVFTGSSFLKSEGATQRSSYLVTVYDAPACRFGDQFLLPDGRKMRDDRGRVAGSGPVLA
jgi:hypothetical protein